MRSTSLKALALRLRAADVGRYHMHYCARRENVAEHSYAVAQIARQIVEVWTPHGIDFALQLEVVTLALDHDVAEVLTGDIPAPTKVGLDLREELYGFEARLLAQHDIDATLVSDDAAKIVKLADALAGFIYCTHEIILRGNVSLTTTHSAYRKRTMGVLELGFPQAVLNFAEQIMKGQP